MLLTAEPVDAQQALEWHMVTKVVPHDRLMEEAETVARQILRNSQRAVRSAKETIAEVIGLHSTSSCASRRVNAYTCPDREETLGLLQRFYDRTDEGRGVVSEHVRYERHGHTALITIDRPEVRNCIGPQTHRELKAAWQRFLDEDDAYVGVLTGAGDQAFCAGGDLTAAREAGTVTLDDADGVLGPSRWTHVHKPTIAAVNGAAYAGGLEWACWTHMAIADEHATFGVTCRRWNIGLADGGTQRLPRIVGWRRAMEMIVTGRVIDARGGAADRPRQRGRPERDVRRARARAGRADRRAAAARDPHRPRGGRARVGRLDAGLQIEAARVHALDLRPGDAGGAASGSRRACGEGARHRRRARDRRGHRRAAARRRAWTSSSSTAPSLPTSSSTSRATRTCPSLGDVDVCVSNAAITTTIAAAHRMTREQWQRDIDVNLTGAFRVIQACLPGMRERGFGRIVVISSGAARSGLPGQVAYAASKAGLLGLDEDGRGRERRARASPPTRSSPGSSRPRRCSRCRRRSVERGRRRHPIGAPRSSRTRSRRPSRSSRARPRGSITGEALSVDGGIHLNTAR